MYQSPGIVARAGPCPHINLLAKLRVPVSVMRTSCHPLLFRLPKDTRISCQGQLQCPARVTFSARVQAESPIPRTLQTLYVVDSHLLSHDLDVNPVAVLPLTVRFKATPKRLKDETKGYHPKPGTQKRKYLSQKASLEPRFQALQVRDLQ